MAVAAERGLIEAIRADAQTLVGAAEDYDRLLDLVGDARVVLLGEASHGTHEFYRHRAEIERFFLALRAGRAAEALRRPRLERAIGVVYRPDTERRSHYFPARLSEQFDAVIHIDETRAVEPLERTPGWDRGEAPETYPFRV